MDRPLSRGGVGSRVFSINGAAMAAVDGVNSLGWFGEAHFLALTPKLDIYVADTLNWRVQKYVKR